MTGTSEAARLRLAAVAAEYLERMGQRIRERREELGLSRADVARAMPGKTNENAIYRWEKGSHRPQDGALEALANVLGVEDWTYFIAAEPDKTETPSPFAGQNGQAELLARVEELLLKQNALLDRQSEILARIEVAIARDSEAARQLAAVDDAFVQRVAQLAAEAIPPEPETRAPARKRHATSRSPQA